MRFDRPSRYLLAALLLGSTLSQADTRTATEWRCQPAAGGEGWDCQPASRPAGPYRLPALPPQGAAVPVAQTPAASPLATDSRPAPVQDQTAAIPPIPTLSPAELDWQPHGDEALVGSYHCNGGYVDPLAALDRAAHDPATAELALSADSGVLQESDNRFVMHGDVRFTQGYQQGQSDRVVVLRDEDRILLDGNVTLREPGLLIRATEAELNTGTGTGRADGVNFVAHEEHARGQAQRLARTGEGTYTLTGARYTTCEPGSRTWEISAGQITLDQNSGIGTARNGVLHLTGIPVAWVPYVQFPIDERRMTGFLWPSFSRSSRSGFDIAAPYYLNLAPNYDATLTPRYIDQRGLLFEAEGRHLSKAAGEWTVGMAYLGGDSRFVDDRIELRRNEWNQMAADFADDPVNNPAPPALANVYDVSDEARWLLSLQQKGNPAPGWRTRIDYTRVSDDQYLRDIGAVSLETRRRVHLLQAAETVYTRDLWRFSATVKDHQTIGFNTSEPYALLPQLALSKQAGGEAFVPDWTLLTEYSYFASRNRIRGQRLYAEPGLTLPMQWNAGFLQPTVKVRHVNYALAESNTTGVVYNYATPPGDPFAPRPTMSWPNDPDFITPKAGTEITGRPSATVPMFSLDGGLYFERDLNWNDRPWLQTLEPRFYYLYADYENQDNLPNFDTGETDFSFQRLFRESRFNGYDRLDDANQLSVGLLSRFIDQQSGREALALGIGQIFYFRDLRVSTTPGADYETRPYSELAAQAVFSPSDSFRVFGTVSWDPDTNKTSEGGLIGQWLPNANALFNLGYRYRRENPRLEAGSCLLGLPAAQREFDWTCRYENRDIEQVEASAVLPLNHQWRLFAKLQYDLTDQRGLESLAGVEYESCCWMIRAVYQEALDGALDWDRNVNFRGDERLQRDYAFYLQFQLKGLGDLADKLDGLLNTSIAGFDRLETRR